MIFQDRENNAANGPRLTERENFLIGFAPIVCHRESLKRFETAVTSALHAGITVREIKEVLIQLTIYAGFPKVLEAIKKLKQILHVELLDTGETHAFHSTGAQSQFNFFKLTEVKKGLNEIDPDFAHFALLNAIDLCDRPGLNPRERSLIILASDICNEVYEGPFQIHLAMAQKSGVPKTVVIDMIGSLSRMHCTRHSAVVAYEIVSITNVPAVTPSRAVHSLLF